MQEIPEAICSLENLEYLDLSYNDLTSLPDKCFNRLRQLQSFRASHNKISSIGLHTFSNKSDLPRLNYISLDNNNLTQIEPWPLIRAQVVPGTEVLLRSNSIHIYTNKIGWKFKCGMETIRGTMRVDDNPLGHISSIVKGFGFEQLVDFLCMYMHSYYTDVDYYAEYVSLNCDCEDFKYFAFLRIFNLIQFNSAICSSPDNLSPSKLLTVNMDQFVCFVRDFCPTGCTCIKQPQTLTLHVNCSSVGLKALPNVVPPINTIAIYKYYLNFSNNGDLTTLHYEDYMAKTRSLDVINSGVATIAAEVWRAFQGMDYVRLENNAIQEFPRYVTSLDFQSTKISLGNNPINCKCENRWMKSWMTSLKENNSLLDHEKILCITPKWIYGKNILTIDEKEFCESPYIQNQDNFMIIIMIIVPFGVVVLSISLTCLLMRRYRVQIHSRLKIHWFDQDECSGEEMLFDIFLTCPAGDTTRGRQILKTLESKRYRVCYHERDFPGGQAIMDNITAAIKGSKRTLCLLSQLYIDSSYCMEEFLIAYHRDVQMKKRRLVVLMMDSAVDLTSQNVTEELRMYLKRYTYINYQSSTWLEQVMYAMPIKRLIDQVTETSSFESVQTIDCDSLHSDSSQTNDCLPLYEQTNSS